MRLSVLSKRTIHGTHIANYFRSPFFLWCEFHAPPAERDPQSEYMQMIMQRGLDHEKAYIRREYPGVVPIEVDTTEEVRAVLRSGAEAFDNLSIFSITGSLLGVPDILERDDSHPSELGSFHYIVKEIKSVKNPKKHHIMQAAFYNYVLGLLQGFTPDTFYLVNKQGDIFPYLFAKYKEELLTAIEEVRRIKAGKKVSPTRGTDYPWEQYSEKMARQWQDVSLITQISLKRKQLLNKAGIKTIKDLAKLSPRRLSKLLGLNMGTCHLIRHHAEAWMAGKPVVFGRALFPKAHTEVYFDLEATMPDEVFGITSQVNYLFGLLIVKAGQETFVPLAAESLEKEGELCRKFLELLESEKDAVIYHFSNFERAQLRRMFADYKVPFKTQKRIMDALVDVQKVLRKVAAFPTPNFGLKGVANFLGFRWRHKEVTAMESMAWYFDYLKGDKEKLQKIIDYNEDDCRATRLVKGWLEKHAARN